MATSMTMSSLALAGDGSFYLVRILGGESVFSSDARLLGNAIRQAPVLLGARVGVTDTHLLSVLLGVGQLIVPAAIWSLALVLSRVRALAFIAVVMAAGLCAGTTWYFSVGENVLAIPLTALVAVLLWQPDEWTWRPALLAVAASTILVATYEAVVLTGPTLALWAGWRAVASKSPVARYGAAIVSATAIFSIARGCTEIVFREEQSHAQSLLYFVVSVEPWQLYLALASCGVLIAAMTLRIERTPRFLFLGAGAVGVTVAISELTPSAVDGFAARGGAMIAALFLELYLFWLWAHDGRPSRTRSETPAQRDASQLLLVVPVLFVGGMMYANVPATDRWSRSLETFRAEVDRARRPSQVDEVLPDDRRQVIWGWTSSSLSLIVRHNADAGILVDPTPSFVPFVPDAARQQLADKYTWRS